MLNCVIADSLALLECLFSHSALLLQLVFVLTALDDVSASQLDGVHQPLEELGKGDRVLFDLLGGLLVFFELFLKETQLLIELILGILRSKGMELGKALEEFSTISCGA